jgi:ubiquinone/menaquinone biosynthesis C-methylase UbiE
MPPGTSTPLHAAELYWNAAAATYEQDFSGTTVGKIRREIVWSNLERIFQPDQHILELSCGTGIDAVFLAKLGVQVLACDLSPRMIELAQELCSRERLPHPPEFRVLPTERLSMLESEGPFDGAFSNFAGLNCVENLTQVSMALSRLLKPKARFLLCMMGRFVPLEILWFLAHRKPRKAFQRLREPRTSYASTTGLVVYRPTVDDIAKQMKPTFRLLGWKGIGIVVPPSYAEHVAIRFPKLIHRLAKVDRHIGPLPIFRSMADCVLLEFERNDNTTTANEPAR